MMLCCNRQSGKSTVSAALGLLAALREGPALVLLLSPSERQSGELFLRVMDYYHALGRPVPATKETALQLHLANGSRVVALPGKEGTIRCYSGVSLLAIDEAARVPDALYCSVRPMLAVSKGRLVALSTPFGKRGWFFEEWHSARPWQRVKVSADRCSRIDPGFLAEERAALGPRWFAQEYECSFEDQIGAYFSGADIEAAFNPKGLVLEFPE
jgi:hypothetical protein